MAKSSLSEKVSREYFCKKFNTALKMWKEKTGKKQEDFAKKIFVSANSFSAYKKGTLPSDETFELMIKEFRNAGLDITEEFFLYSTHEEKYRSSKEYVEDEVVRGRMDFAEEIGVSLEFLRFVWDCIDTSQYPVWSPIIKLPTGQPFENEYKRKPLMKTEVDTDFLQVQTDEGKYLLGDIDIHILKDIQRQVECFIEYLFLQRRKDMEEEVLEANKQYRIPLDDTGLAFGYSPLSPEKLIAIDGYMKYLKFVEGREDDGQH